MKQTTFFSRYYLPGAVIRYDIYCRSHIYIIEAISFWINKHQGTLKSRFPKEFILEGIKLILKIIFSYLSPDINSRNAHLVHQNWYSISFTIVTAMGTKVAPTYATLVWVFLRKVFYRMKDTVWRRICRYIETHWKRYLEYCFIFTKTLQCTRSSTFLQYAESSEQ
jgi:hypothetical protein